MKSTCVFICYIVLLLIIAIQKNPTLSDLHTESVGVTFSYFWFTLVIDSNAIVCDGR